MTTLNEILQPNEITWTIAIFIVGILLLIVYLGVMLRSPIVLVMFSITLMIFTLIILISIPFVWFWITVMLSALIISIASIERYT